MGISNASPSILLGYSYHLPALTKGQKRHNFLNIEEGILNVARILIESSVQSSSSAHDKSHDKFLA